METEIAPLKLITFLIILSIGLYIIYFINNRYSSTMTEQFTNPNYLDIKTKTTNWCDKMRKTGLLTSSQFDQCIAAFRDQSAGILTSNTGNTPQTGTARNYSIYDKTTSASNAGSGFGGSGDSIGGDSNSRSVLLITFDGKTMASNTENTIYFVSNINDSGVNQRELQMTLAPQTESTFAILSPYGKYLVANQDYTVGFTGTSIGPMSSWNISNINGRITIQSVQFANFYLTFDDNLDSIKLVYGQTESSLWKTVNRSESESNNNGLGVGAGTNSFIGAEYMVSKENILNKIKNAVIGKMILERQIAALQDLTTQISNNYADIVKYINQTLSNAKNIYQLSTADYQTRLDSITSNSMLSDDARQNLISSLTRPGGMNITEDTITMAINVVITARDRKLNTINRLITDLQSQNSKIDLRAIDEEYTTYLATLQQTIDDLNKRIDQNSIILTRQQNAYSTVNSELNENQNKIIHYKNKDEIANVNIDILSNYNSQNGYLLKLYPIAILILFIAILYVIYITYSKFITNVYNKY